MRIVISTLNLVAAIRAAGISMLALVALYEVESILFFFGCLVWVFCAVWLFRGGGVLPWFVSLIFVSAGALAFGSTLLRFHFLAWRAQKGDRSIEVDPSTIGMPLFGSLVLTLGALVLLVALLCLPAWPNRRGHRALPNAAVNGGRVPPVLDGGG